MPNRVRILALVALLVCAVAVMNGCDAPAAATPTPEPTAIPGSESVTATLRTYYDPAGRFTIGYPPSWEVSEGEQQVEFIEPYGNLHILVQYADAGQIMDETMMRTLIDQYFATEEAKGVGSFTREKETALDSSTIRVEYSFLTGEVPGYGRSTFQQRGTYLYVLSFWVQQRDLWAANETFFATVAQTLMPTPPSP